MRKVDPREPGKIAIYACGPTVYGRIHVGNARPFVVFSLLSYGLAFKERGAAIVSNSITIARLGQNGLPASLTTYMGVFVANEGDFHIRISGDVLAQPSPDTIPSTGGKLIGPTDESATKIMPVQDGTDLTLQDASNWTLHSILFEREQQIPEGLISHLAIQNGTLVGSVSNTLGYTLDDAFLLLPNDALSLGSHSITAVYRGDTSFGTSTSTAVAQAVNQATTATTGSRQIQKTAADLGAAWDFWPAIHSAYAVGRGGPWWQDLVTLATVMRGGLVRLPHNADFVIAGLDLEPGYAFACMAETLLMGPVLAR